MIMLNQSVGWLYVGPVSLSLILNYLSITWCVNDNICRMAEKEGFFIMQIFIVPKKSIHFLDSGFFKIRNTFQQRLLLTCEEITAKGTVTERFHSRWKETSVTQFHGSLAVGKHEKSILCLLFISVEVWKNRYLNAALVWIQFLSFPSRIQNSALGLNWILKAERSLNLPSCYRC